MTSLRAKAVQGTKWSAVSQGAGVTLNVLQMVVLARLLSPEDFGLVAMASVVVGFARAFQDVGISNAIIHRQDTTAEQLSSLYWLNVAAGFSALLILWCTTPLVASFYNEPRLTGILFWLALSVLLTSFGQQYAVLLQKNLRFKELALTQTLAAVTATCVAIAAALLGEGAYSLVYGQLVQALVMSLLLWWAGCSEWRPKLSFSRGHLRGYLAFGIYQMGERCTNYYATSVDTLLIGRFLGPEALGLYNIAYNLIVVPLRNINPVLTKVAFPILARRQGDDAALRRGYLEMMRLLTFVTVPCLVGLAVTAPWFVPVVFGSQWTAAVPIVQILSLVGILKCQGNPMGSILLAKGRADIGFKWNVMVAIVNTCVFWGAAQASLLAVAMSYAVVSVLYWFGGRLILERLIGLKWREYIVALRVPIICAATMGLVVHVAGHAVRQTGWSPGIVLGALVVGGVFVYAACIAVLAADYFRELTVMFFKSKPRKV